LGEAKREFLLRPPKRGWRLFRIRHLIAITGFILKPMISPPDRLCVESKSLKFYLVSYRNERAFNEAVTNRILDDFVKACAPREAIVTAQFSARGGIALTVRAEYPDRKSGRDNERR